MELTLFVDWFFIRDDSFHTHPEISEDFVTGNGAVVAELSDGSTAIVPPPNTAAGTFDLTIGGVTTSQVPFNASAEQVKLALDTLETVSPNDVTVTKNSSGTYTVTFE